MADQAETVKELSVGEQAPDFTLPSTSGEVSLQDFKGRYVVLYFYPKDDTPGCTTEACEFRDSNATIKQAGAVILGISPDDPKSHAEFAAKYHLPFVLLSDEEHKTAEAYGAWQLKTNYGKTYWGIQRSTFLIGPDGKLIKIWPKVKPEGHSAEVLNALEEANAG